MRPVLTRLHGRWTDFFAVVAVLLGGVATRAAAASQSRPTTPTAANATGGSSSSGNHTAGGGLVPDFPTPKELAKGMVEWAIGSLISGIEGFVGTFNEIVLGLPAPGSRTEPATWIHPTTGWWPGVWDTYVLLVPLGLCAVLGGFLVAVDEPPLARREQLRASAEALTAIFVGWPVIGLLLHLGDATALLLAPSGSEFLATPGSSGKLGLGVVLGGALIVFQTVVVVMGIVILFAQFFLAHALVAFWPLLWGFRALPLRGVESAGSIGVAGLVTLVVLKVMQAGILRLLFEIPWDAGHPGTMLWSMVGTTVGLLVATVYLPKLAVGKMLPAAILMVGSGMEESAAGRAGDLKNRARETVGAVRERRGGEASDGVATRSRDHSTTVGEVQSRQATYSRPDQSRRGGDDRTVSIGRSDAEAERDDGDDGAPYIQ